MAKKKRYKYFEHSGNKTWNWLRCLYNISYIHSIWSDNDFTRQYKGWFGKYFQLDFKPIRNLNIAIKKVI